MNKRWIGLGILLGLGQAAEAAEIEMNVLLKSDRSWNGAALPAYPSGPAEITILKATLQPGAALTPHLHPVINGGVVLTGELTVETESGQTIRLEAGDALLEVVDTWHFGRNSGSSVTELIIFYAGSPGQEITVLQSAPD